MIRLSHPAQPGHVFDEAAVLQVPGPVRAWVDRITKRFPFERIISGHFASPIDARPQDFRRAGPQIMAGRVKAGG